MQYVVSIKVKIENQISLIGGTMGLFTGFSIISGIEVVYYAIKVFVGAARVKKGKKARNSN